MQDVYYSAAATLLNTGLNVVTAVAVAYAARTLKVLREDLVRAREELRPDVAE